MIHLITEMPWYSWIWVIVYILTGGIPLLVCLHIYFHRLSWELYTKDYLGFLGHSLIMLFAIPISAIPIAGYPFVLETLLEVWDDKPIYKERNGILYQWWGTLFRNGGEIAIFFLPVLGLCCLFIFEI